MIAIRRLTIRGRVTLLPASSHPLPQLRPAPPARDILDRDRDRLLLADNYDHGGRRATTIYAIAQTAILNGHDPQAFLADILARIADHPINRIDELLPWQWCPTGQAQTSTEKAA